MIIINGQGVSALVHFALKTTSDEKHIFDLFNIMAEDFFFCSTVHQ